MYISRNSQTFKSVEDKVGSAYASVKVRDIFLLYCLYRHGSSRDNQHDTGTTNADETNRNNRVKTWAQLFKTLLA